MTSPREVSRRMSGTLISGSRLQYSGPIILEPSFQRRSILLASETRIVAPGLDDRSVRTAAGEVLYPPSDWILMPPGDPALTRRIKATGPSWTVQEKRGRKVFSRGVWAPQILV